LFKKIRKNRYKPQDLRAFERIQKTALKIIDKLHANKQQTEITGNSELPFIIKVIKDDGKPDQGKDS
jgi:hypothetical protein